MPRLSHLGLHNAHVTHITPFPPVQLTHLDLDSLRFSAAPAEYASAMEMRQATLSNLRNELLLAQGDLLTLAAGVARLQATQPAPRAGPCPTGGGATQRPSWDRDPTGQGLGPSQTRGGSGGDAQGHALLGPWLGETPWLEAVLQLNQLLAVDCDRRPVTHQTATRASSPSLSSTSAESSGTSGTCADSASMVSPATSFGSSMLSMGSLSAASSGSGDPKAARGIPTVPTRHPHHMWGASAQLSTTTSGWAPFLPGRPFPALRSLSLHLATSNTICGLLCLCSGGGQGGAQALTQLRISYPQPGPCTKAWVRGLLSLTGLQALELEGTQASQVVNC